MSTDTETAAAGPGNSSPRLPHRYIHDWALFTDWCQACDHRALPAHPTVVAEFHADHPAAAGTQRRRVTAINAVHTTHGLPAPGLAETVRQLLNDARAERVERIRAVAWQRIPQIPAAGWPGGLFGRRDALILTLMAGGLGYEDIARLRRADLTAEDEALIVRVEDRWTRIQDGGGPVSAATVSQRWGEVLGFLDRYPSTQLLAQRLDRAGADLSVFANALRRDDRPLFTPIDRWGHTPFAPTTLSAQSVAALARAHLTGQAPVHRRLPLRLDTVERASDTSIEIVNVELDTGYYDRGIVARRDAHSQLEDVTDILDAIEDETDRILADLLAILDGAGTRAE
ncbi:MULTISPECIES: hypothetical protein [Rhodococcus]|uniref:Recombinase n=1 Tax=Rhodococcus opacus RKJ300 = JCM 13270 TaxID=1165867 RepID=I0WKQ4_RHOOP|nr:MULTISPECIES: hypothetical protein [Rhodococcus]EID76970.1 hypothetical protein W59_25636 [Rhodococcus opacus RKJ300 = JCM 13270]QQZ18853.1 hypothetical protein GO592_35610 [Rhodococcus sp. 21391]